MTDVTLDPMEQTPAKECGCGEMCRCGGDCQCCEDGDCAVHQPDDCSVV